MTPCVLLLHDEPDGGWHFDWMLARWPEVEDERGPGPLITFRTHVRPDEDVHGFDAERVADHRAAYLMREGEVSGGRGQVRRVARGWCILDEEGPERMVVTVELGGHPRRLIGHREESGDRKASPLGRWRFESASTAWTQGADK